MDLVRVKFEGRVLRKRRGSFGTACGGAERSTPGSFLILTVPANRATPVVSEPAGTGRVECSIPSKKMPLSVNASRITILELGIFLILLFNFSYLGTCFIAPFLGAPSGLKL